MTSTLKHVYLLSALAVVGRFATEGDAATAAGGLGDATQTAIIKSPDDLNKYSELELRTIRAGLTITEPTDNLGEAAAKVIEANPKDFKKNKDKAAEVKRLWASMEAKDYGQGAVTAAAASTPKEPKINAKGHLRNLFKTVGTRVSFADMCKVDDKNSFTPSATRTAVSDLKNEKYSGGPVMFLQRDGDDYVRTADNSPPPEIAEAKAKIAADKKAAAEKAQAEAKAKREADKAAKAEAAAAAKAAAATSAPAGTSEPVPNPPGVTTTNATV